MLLVLLQGIDTELLPNFYLFLNLCGMENVVTIFTACSKVVSNLVAIYWKRPFKQSNAFSTTTRLMLSSKLNLTSSGLRLPRSEQGFMSQFPKNMLNHQVLSHSILHYRFVLACLLTESSFSGTLCIRESS